MLLFAAVAFTNAFLLFLVQPLFARMALPLLGGAPAVWTTCVLFFQCMLLAGYVYAHGTVRALGVRRQAVLHAGLVLCSLVVLPFSRPAPPDASATAAPVVWLLAQLTASIGLPFLVLSTSAPLLQRWLAAGADGRDPYRLYAASNLGSLVALLAYPFMVEPLLALETQRILWSAGYVLNTAVLLICLAVAWRGFAGSRMDGERTAAPPLARRLRWLALSALPSALMLGVTAHITTDIAALPLFWIVPLALYLTTFIVAFGGRARPFLVFCWRAMPLSMLAVVLFVASGTTAALWLLIPLHLLNFFLLAQISHAELARLRPDAGELTGFYVWVAAGGMLGGLFSTFGAPQLFVHVGEYALLLIATLAVVVPMDSWRLLRSQPSLVARPALAGAITTAVLWASVAGRIQPDVVLPLLGAAVVVGFSVSRQPAAFAVGITLMLVPALLYSDRGWGNVEYAERTFFGTYRVVRDPSSSVVSLYHGTTLHGSASRRADRARDPLTYYHRGSPIAEAVAMLEAERPLEAGVVGLGIGSLAAYAEAGDRWTFFEIDGAVERIARDTRYFPFLNACGSACRVIVGDGRVSLARSDETFDLLVIDAFSSDAIPIHLLTREAMNVYLERLAPGGLLAFHISNRHFDLEPVLGRAVADLELTAAVRHDDLTSANRPGMSRSSWLVAARDPATIQRLLALQGWRTPELAPGAVWSDDYANLLAAVR